MCQPRAAVALGGLVGKDSAVESLALAVQVALDRDKPLGHVLLSGPPGLGKATLARAIARQLGTRVRYSNAALVRNPSGIVDLLTRLGRHDVLFIDEIHSLPLSVVVYLSEALTDFRVTLMLNCGAESKMVVLRLPPFTLIGATIHAGLLPLEFLCLFEHLEYLPSPRRDAPTAAPGSASPARSRSA